MKTRVLWERGAKRYVHRTDFGVRILMEAVGRHFVATLDEMERYAETSRRIWEECSIAMAEEALRFATSERLVP